MVIGIKSYHLRTEMNFQYPQSTESNDKSILPRKWGKHEFCSPGPCILNSGQVSSSLYAACSACYWLQENIGIVAR